MERNQIATDNLATEPAQGGRLGRIISVSSLKVDIFMERSEVGIRDLVYTWGRNGEPVWFEVAEINGSVASAICFGMANGLRRGMDVYMAENGIQVAYDDAILGHVFNSYGQTIDGTRLPPEVPVRNIYDRSLAMDEIVIDGDILWTGIKVLD